MAIADELFKIADQLESHSKMLQEKGLDKPLQLIKDAAINIGNAWSGSWLGYHARVYYAKFEEPPPGAHFSQEWGLKEIFAQETRGEWQEYRFNDVVSEIYRRCGDTDTKTQNGIATTTQEIFEEAHSTIKSLLSPVLENKHEDKFLKDIAEQVDKIKVLTTDNLIDGIRPSGRIMSRDMVAIQSGLHTPPHIGVQAEILAIESPFNACKELSKLARRAASHMQNLEKHKVRSERIGTNVFIGHGRSSLWKDLKDFIQDRIHLPWDEFNRVPVAGVANVVRLSQMLDEGAIAFLIMTAEDEQLDGKQQARQNVVHEAGLFQGRLGFERAIILLEEGCEEFSNIHGLGQIRFPKGNLSAVFEDVRKVLEREGLIN